MDLLYESEEEAFREEVRAFIDAELRPIAPLIEKEEKTDSTPLPTNLQANGSISAPGLLAVPVAFTRSPSNFQPRGNNLAERSALSKELASKSRR